MQDLYIDFNSIMLEEFSKVKTASNEDTSISGTITAEEGKEKSVSFGGNTITSIGSEIKFLWNKNNRTKKDFESKYKQLDEKLAQRDTRIATLESRLDSLLVTETKSNSTKESEKNTASKTKKRTGPWWIWLIIAAIVVGYLYHIFGKKWIPFI